MSTRAPFGPGRCRFEIRRASSVGLTPCVPVRIAEVEEGTKFSMPDPLIGYFQSHRKLVEGDALDLIRATPRSRSTSRGS